MFILTTAATDLIQVTCGSAADLEVDYEYIDYNSTTFAITGLQGTPRASITNTTTTTIVTGAASTKRFVKTFNMVNRSATQTTVSVERTDGTNVVQLAFVTLLQNETLVYTESGIWIHYDANMGVYPNTGIYATQADQETSTALDRVVTPGRQHFHPSACKAWITAGVTGNNLASYNITSLTDTGTGDIAVTINVDFSSALYAVAMAVQRTNSTAAEANERIGTIKTASLAAGSFSMDCWDTTTTTNVIKDPTTWHAVCFGDQ